MMHRSLRTRVVALAAVCLVPLYASLVVAPEPVVLPFHPHFQKVLTCKLSKELTITVRYQTVTFDKQGAKKMAVGKAWHLAGAMLETTGDLVIGGEKVKAGKYALSARKTKKGFELTLHAGRGFSTKLGEDAHILKTEFDDDSLMFEHMNIDVQPGGDKQNTQLYLDVRFDKMLAQTLIEIPE